MNEKEVTGLLELIKKINKETTKPATLTDMALRGVMVDGVKLNAKARRKAIECLVERKSIITTTALNGSHNAYIAVEQLKPAVEETVTKPLPKRKQDNTQSKVFKIIKQSLEEIGYSTQITDKEVLEFVKASASQTTLWYFKTQILTRQGAIAREVLEQIHFNYIFADKKPVSIAQATKELPNPAIKSTYSERREALESLVSNGFIKVVRRQYVPVEKLPSFNVYKKVRGEK